MKHFLILLLLSIGIHSFGQVTCTVLPEEVTLCYGGRITLIATAEPDSMTFTYEWMKGSTIITDSTRRFLVLQDVTFADTGNYRCIATSTEGLSGTSNIAHLGMFAKLTMDTLYRSNALGCPGTCKGQMKTHISGGHPPYVYDWPGELQDTLAYGLCEGKYILKVIDNDTSHCVSRAYTVETLKIPDIIFTKKPGDTVYLTNPYLTVEYPDSSRHNISTWTWKFGDKSSVEGVNPATHAYGRTGFFVVSLVFTDTHGCVDSVSDSLTVRTINLKINPILTPNGDQTNDTFLVKEKITDTNYQNVDLSIVYLSTEMIIFDRWGKKVYQANNYKSGDWDGGNLADGVYFYVFKCHGQYGDDVYRGSVTIMGRNFSPAK